MIINDVNIVHIVYIYDSIHNEYHIMPYQTVHVSNDIAQYDIGSCNNNKSLFDSDRYLYHFIGLLHIINL